MRDIIRRLFILNWPRKVVALITAIIVWFLVDQSITVVRTLPSIPVRIINLPENKTVVGLRPNGILKYPVTITIKGMKSQVDTLLADDLEVVINAEGKKESWIAVIDKKNLIDTSVTDVDWRKNISSVTGNDIFIRLSPLVTEEVPLTINKPIGDPPKGYQFLDVWPKYLSQKVTGPQETVQKLKEHGLEITYNLSHISKEELDSLQVSTRTDEISFLVPSSWKKVRIPFKENALEPINDPRAKLLRIDFLKQELIPLAAELPITIFFPVKYSRTINPKTYSLATNDIVEKKSGLKLLTLPLYVKDVSRLFLDVVRDNLLFTVTAIPKNVETELPWDVEVIGQELLEDAYVEATLKEMEEVYKNHTPFTKHSEESIRARFREYVRQLEFFTKDGEKLSLRAELEATQISLEVEE